jgi:hypothetical protein
VTEDYSACIQDLKDQFAHSGRRRRHLYRKQTINHGNFNNSCNGISQLRRIILFRKGRAGRRSTPVQNRRLVDAGNPLEGFLCGMLKRAWGKGAGS